MHKTGETLIKYFVLYSFTIKYSIAYGLKTKHTYCITRIPKTKRYIIGGLFVQNVPLYIYYKPRVGHNGYQTDV